MCRADGGRASRTANRPMVLISIYRRYVIIVFRSFLSEVLYLTTKKTKNNNNPLLNTEIDYIDT